MELSERAELGRLRAERLEGQIAALKAAGKLAPASEPLARALLAAPAVVTLSDGTGAPASETFRRFLEAQPPVVPLGEWARARTAALSGGASGAAASTVLGGGEGGAPEFSEADREVLRRLGVSPEDVAATMEKDRPHPAR